MSTTLTTLDAILKTQYIGPLNEQLNQDLKLFKRLENSGNSTVVGKNFTLPLHYGRNEGVGAIAEGADLPTAGNQAYADAIVPMRYLYGVINLTGQSIQASKNDKGAFVKAVESEMKGVAQDLKNDINRQLFGDGSGRLAAATTNASTSTTITVDSTKYLRVGMAIDIIDTSGTASVTNAKITAVTSTTFTHNGTAAAVAANSHVYRHGSRNIEVMGLSGIVAATDPASGSLQGLAVATNPWWKGNVLGNSGTNRSITLALMRQAADAVEVAGSGRVSAIYASYGVRRAYEALLKASFQFVNVMDLDGGVKALAYDDMPIFAEKDCQANRMYFLDEKMLEILTLGNPGFDWMSEDGAILHRGNGKDNYAATLYRYMNLGCRARNAHTLLADITEA